MAKYIIPSVYKGDTFDDLQFTLSIDGTPEDLTNYAIACKFRIRSKVGDEVKSISIGSGITLVDAVNGVFKIDAFGVDWVVATYYYDIQFTLAGVIDTYIEGKMDVIQDVTY